MMHSNDVDMLNEWNKPFANRKYPKFLAKEKEKFYNAKKLRNARDISTKKTP